MTAIFSTRRRDQSPTGPIFHIAKTKRRKPAISPELRELRRDAINRQRNQSPGASRSTGQ